jgi:hypothetical protein
MTAGTGHSDRHLSSFHLELLRLGEASGDERAWIDRHLRECPRCGEMASAFESHRREFGARESAAKAPPPGALETRRGGRATARIGFGILLPVAAAVALFLSVKRPSTPVTEPEILAKGEAGLMLVARRGARVFPVEPNEKLRAGDQIRFVVSHPRHRYLLIGSIDGSGHASIYFPYEGAESAEIGRRDRFEVPGSIVIDATPGPERFFALFSGRPLQTTSIRRALDAVGKQGTNGIRNRVRLEVGADEQISILVEKETH